MQEITEEITNNGLLCKQIWKIYKVYPVPLPYLKEKMSLTVRLKNKINKLNKFYSYWSYYNQKQSKTNSKANFIYKKGFTPWSTCAIFLADIHYLDLVKSDDY